MLNSSVKKTHIKNSKCKQTAMKIVVKSKQTDKSKQVAEKCKQMAS